MSSTQNRMREEYNIGLGQMGPIEIPYRLRIKLAIEEGLLIFIKYALVLALTYIALQFGTNIVSGSINGTQSALYLTELQNKGYLPKVVNGTVPDKLVGDGNATSNTK